mgnify:CR=1 FL=1
MNKLTSIIIGVVLVLGMGTLVYVTKKPAYVPMDNSVNTETVNTTTANPIKSTTGGVIKNIKSDDEDEDEGGTTVTTTPAPASTPVTTTSGITIAQVAKHNSSTSCWSAINGSVYDLTSWIPNHPGGSRAILSICGIDGSDAYNGQHGGSGKPARILGGFKIGALTK